MWAGDAVLGLDVCYHVMYAGAHLMPNHARMVCLQHAFTAGDCRRSYREL
jgi:hypothetical protein